MKPIRPIDSPRTKNPSFPGFKQITIVGVGLLGGSLGMVCKQQGLAGSIVGTGRRVENLKKAQELKAIDRYATDPAEAAAGADLLVLATPVDTFETILKSCASVLAPNAIVTGCFAVPTHTVSPSRWLRTRAGMASRAMTALSFLREAVAMGQATPSLVQHVSAFLRKLPAEQPRLFAPPPAGLE